MPTEPVATLLVRPIRFVRRGEIVSIANVPPSRTLLDLLREDLGCTGTKEGCGEGDCGACTVVLGEENNGAVRYRAVNSCIRLAHSIDGLALWTVEDIAGAGGALHPAQQAMVEAHGSQCGFCTPGFVMSLFGMYNNHVGKGNPITRAMAVEELSGNLCRCTGYRPILDAAQAMSALPAAVIDEDALLSKLELLAHDLPGLEADLPYKSPRTLAALLQQRAANPSAQLVAGCTDVGLWVTKQHRDLGDLIYTGTVAELKRIETTSTHLEIGAAVTLSDVMRPLATHFPDFRELLRRYGSPPIRHAATLGGNIANGSPIGDSMPALIVLGATVVLRASDTTREMPLEDFYLGYQKTVLGTSEFVERIRIPLPEAALAFRTYKISKRFDQDISALCGAFAARIVNGRIGSIRIAFGGMAATAARARATEAALLDQPWTEATVRIAQAALETDYAPISDMRASAAYRRTVAGNLLKKFFIETNARVSRHPSRLYDLRDLRDLRNEGNVGDVPV